MNDPLALSHPHEVDIVGDPGAADTLALLDVCVSGYRPHHILALGEPEADPVVPLLQNRSLVDGRVTAYVCVDFVCRSPVTDPEALLQLVRDL